MKNCFLLLFSIAVLQVFSSNPDSIFIDSVKKFAFKEMNVELKGDLFTKWSVENDPYIYVYISRSDKVEQPEEISSPFIYCGLNKDIATSKEQYCKENGWDFFNYKTYANSATLLNKRFMQYSREAKCMIIFHELTHNYISQLKLKIPYEYNEAICDILGNYGPLKYYKTAGMDSISVVRQKNINESIYLLFNTCIENINSNSLSAHRIRARCQRKTAKLLKKGNLFQKDRFSAEVNNAYLLKNQFYSKNYFLLKKIFIKQGSVNQFLEIIKKLPEKKEEGTKYLEKYT